MKFYIQTFGCQMNENDSRLMASLLVNQGYEETALAEQADVVIINTCCVRENAENKALGYLGSIKKLYEADRKRIIVLCGCMLQQPGVAEMIHEKYRYARILIGTFAASRLPEYIAEVEATGKTILDVEERYDHSELRRCIAPGQDGAVESYRAQVNISYGCNNFCSYCIVPYVRGRERSRRPQEILDEVRFLAKKGVREVQLLGQNVNSYGKDFPAGESCDFPTLLAQLQEIEEIRRIRYMTSHPKDFHLDFVERICQLDKVCNHFHLPLQYGNNDILQRMNRGYTTEKYWALLSAIRENDPAATVTTDLIVGFPGETEAQFAETLAFVERCRFDAAYTFIYSRRSGTPAAKMPDQVPEEIKRERLQRLMDVQNAISLEKNQAMLGTRQELMVDGPSKNNPEMWSGRTEGNKIVVFPIAQESRLQPGDLVSVQITEAKTWNLVGTLL